MVGQLWKSLTRCNACAQEFIIRIVHLIATEDSFQARFIEGFVMCHKGKAINQRLYLFPHLRKYRCIFSVLTSQAMHLAAPIIIIVGLRLDQRIKSIYNLAITHYHYANGANTGSLIVLSRNLLLQSL